MTELNIAPLSREDGLDEAWLRETQELQAEKPLEIPPRYVGAESSVFEVKAWVHLILRAVRDKYRDTGNLPKFAGGPSLLLLGPTGTGKTYEAYAALRALSESRARGSLVFSSAADLYARLRPRPGLEHEREFDGFAKAAVLILDDLGAAKGSEWVDEITYRLINYRYEHMLPTLITSNLTPEQLPTILGERVASRLAEMCKQVSVKGSDRRRTRG